MVIGDWRFGWIEGCAEMVVVVDRGSAGRIAVPSGLVAQWDSAGRIAVPSGLVAQWDSAGRIAVPSGLAAQWDSAGMNPLLSTWKSVETDSALRAQSEGFAWTEQAALAPLGHGKQVHRFA